MLKPQKYKTSYMGNIITCSIHCNYRIAATLYTIETWFVSGIYALHKGDYDNLMIMMIVVIIII
jgi:hypothetical protein